MGPLNGLRVLELEAIGPVPLACMLMSDMGADVFRVRRPPDPNRRALDPRYELLDRGRRHLFIDLKDPNGPAALLEHARNADVLVEGLRPGVMERLGVGPGECLAANPSLIYARMTGWGQSGPMAGQAGHDINYVSLTGALHAMGTKQSPSVPLNLVGDFGGGAMFLLVGVLAALHERKASGKGQVIDAAMVDGVLNLMTPFFGRLQSGEWKDEREANLLDGGAHFYRTYRTSDGKFLAVGAIEAPFYSALLKGMGLDAASLPPQHSREQWPEMTKTFAEVFAQHPRAHWVRIFARTDACVTPVLTMEEAMSHEHLAARECFSPHAGAIHPAPAPRFSRTPSEISTPTKSSNG